MKTRSEYSNDRRSFLRTTQALLMRKAAHGRLTLTARNITRISAIRRAVDATMAAEGSGLGVWIGKKILDLLGLNRLYFKSFVDEGVETAADLARNATMLRLGYDIETERLIPGGWLDDLARNTQVGQIVGNQINRALATRQGLGEFRRNFKQVFTDPNGLGIVERHFYTNSFDMFQQYDRAISKQYADELELDYFLYSGTVKDNTRDFCRARVGRVFTREEIESWASLSWSGKPKGYNPYTDQGGFNCRHGLDPISEELAESIKNR